MKVMVAFGTLTSMTLKSRLDKKFGNDPAFGSGVISLISVFN
jgi:hypothetical protein